MSSIGAFVSAAVTMYAAKNHTQNQLHQWQRFYDELPQTYKCGSTFQVSHECKYCGGTRREANNVHRCYSCGATV